MKEYSVDGKKYIVLKAEGTIHPCEVCSLDPDGDCPTFSYRDELICNDIDYGYLKELPAPMVKLQLPVKEVQMPTNPNIGTKYDTGKIQWWYMPIEPMKEVLKVLAYGDTKYPAEDGCNWKRVPNAKKRYYSALMRHITAWWDGEKYDSETKLHHLAHAGTNILFLLWFELKGYPEDTK
jgi:Domain of unknown function (DUF5664)